VIGEKVTSEDKLKAIEERLLAAASDEWQAAEAVA
jgi:hypothetical protein